MFALGILAFIIAIIWIIAEEYLTDGEKASVTILIVLSIIFTTIGGIKSNSSKEEKSIEEKIQLGAKQLLRGNLIPQYNGYYQDSTFIVTDTIFVKNLK